MGEEKDHYGGRREGDGEGRSVSNAKRVEKRDEPRESNEWSGLTKGMIKKRTFIFCADYSKKTDLKSYEQKSLNVARM